MEYAEMICIIWVMAEVMEGVSVMDYQPVATIWCVVMPVHGKQLIPLRWLLQLWLLYFALFDMTV